MAMFEMHYPLKPSQLRQPFGVNKYPDGKGPDYTVLLGFKGHPGEDWANIVNGQDASYGQPIYAACDGKVIEWLKDSNGGWNFVTVTNQQFYDETDGGQSFRKVVYDHCIEGSNKFNLGDQVKLGDIIALCGSSGVVKGQPVDIPTAHVHVEEKPAILMAAVGIEPAYYANKYPNNGFGGGVDNSKHWSGKYAVDIRAEEDTVAAATSVVAEISSAPITPQQKSAFLLKVEQILRILLKFFQK